MAERSLEEMEQELRQLEQKIVAEKLRRTQSTQGLASFPQQSRHVGFSARRQSAATAMSSTTRRQPITMTRSFTAQPTPSLMDRGMSMSSEHSMPLLSSIYENQFADIPQDMLDRFGQDAPANAYMLQRAVPAPECGINPSDFLNSMDDVGVFAGDDLYCPLPGSSAPPSLVPDSGESNGTPMSRESSSAGTVYLRTRGLSLSGSSQQSPSFESYPSQDPYLNSHAQRQDTAKPQMSNDMLIGLGSGLSVEMSRSISNLSTSSMRSTQSNQERRAKEARERQIENSLRNHIQPKPSGEADKAETSLSNASSKKDGKMPLPTKKTYIRPKHDRVKCKRCDDHPNGFRGHHELQRHMASKHQEHVKKFICRDPRSAGLTSLLTPVIPLSKCKACQQGKKYGAYYNAAAHMRRAHFREKSARKGGKRGTGESKANKQADWPPMADLKPWMEEVYVRADAVSEADESVDADIMADEDVDAYPWHALAEHSLPSPPDTDSSSPTFAGHMSPDMTFVDILDPSYSTRGVPTPLEYHDFPTMSMGITT